jgi:hypothetical protein
VLPPVGSAASAIHLIEGIEHHRLANLATGKSSFSYVRRGGSRASALLELILSWLEYSSSLHPGGPQNDICVEFRSPAGESDLFSTMRRAIS